VVKAGKKLWTRPTANPALAWLVIVLLALAPEAMAAEVRAAHYGTTRDGKAVTAYTLVNGSGASATILDFGGTIIDLRVPDRHGALGNVVLSFSDLAAWESVGNANAIVGRFANRIRGGFELDGVHYPLQQNAAGITLHGGSPAYSTRIWTVSPPTAGDGASITMTLDSPNGDQGFPGTLSVSATYRLSDDNALRLDLRATTYQATVINLTNHIYFNLNGNSTTSVEGHRLQLLSDRVAFRDPLNVPTGALVAVEGSPLDLRNARTLADLIAAASDPRFAGPATPTVSGRPRTFDYAYLLDKAPDMTGRPVARLEDDISGRVMELTTSEPTIQVFITDNSRPGLLSDVGRPLSPWPAVALETQHLPDSPNQPSFPTTVLRPGEIFRSTTIWAFRTR
jgi:aldose 1-epimerase